MFFKWISCYRNPAGFPVSASPSEVQAKMSRAITVDEGLD